MVVEYKLDYLAMAEHERIRVDTVHPSVCRVIAGCQCSIQCWYFGRNPSNAVQECAETLSKHLGVRGHGMPGLTSSRRHLGWPSQGRR